MAQLNEETTDCRTNQGNRTWDAVKIASALMVGAAGGGGGVYLQFNGQAEADKIAHVESQRLVDTTIDSITEFDPNMDKEEVGFEFLEGRRDTIVHKRILGMDAPYLEKGKSYTLAILNKGIDGDYILMEYPEIALKPSQRARFIEAEGMQRNMFPYKGMDVVKLSMRGKYRTVLQSNKPFPDYTKVWLAKREGKR